MTRGRSWEVRFKVGSGVEFVISAVLGIDGGTASLSCLDA